MLKSEQIAELFHLMGLDTAEQRASFLPCTPIVSTTEHEKQVFIELTNVTYPEPRKETSRAKLERHSK